MPGIELAIGTGVLIRNSTQTSIEPGVPPASVYDTVSRPKKLCDSGSARQAPPASIIATAVMVAGCRNGAASGSSQNGSASSTS
jgi:hypothetical protein